MEYKLIHTAELERIAAEMNCDLIEAAHDVIICHYMDRGYSYKDAVKIVGRDHYEWLRIFDECMKEEEYIRKHGKVKGLDSLIP